MLFMPVHRKPRTRVQSFPQIFHSFVKTRISNIYAIVYWHDITYRSSFVSPQLVIYFIKSGLPDSNGVLTEHLDLTDTHIAFLHRKQYIVPCRNVQSGSLWPFRFDSVWIWIRSSVMTSIFRKGMLPRQGSVASVVSVARAQGYILLIHICPR